MCVVGIGQGTCYKRIKTKFEYFLKIEFLLA